MRIQEWSHVVGKLYGPIFYLKFGGNQTINIEMIKEISRIKINLYVWIYLKLVVIASYDIYKEPEIEDTNNNKKTRVDTPEEIQFFTTSWLRTSLKKWSEETLSPFGLETGLTLEQVMEVLWGSSITKWPY